MRNKIDILVRNIEEEEVRPGVYSYKYTRYRNIPCNIVENKSFNISDSRQINETIKSNFDFSFIFANDDLDRVNRIYYVIYKGRVYGVQRVQSWPPRVRVTPDNIMGLESEDLAIEVVDYE